MEQEKLAQQNGVLPSQWIQQAMKEGWLQSHKPFESKQLQPNSLDLRIGNHAYRVQSSFLPGEEGMARKLERFSWYDFEITEEGTVLERNQVYIIPLMEQLHLPEGVYGYANPKSSTGRVDVFARLVTTHGSSFDKIPAQYHGPLFLEVVPRSFPIVVRPNDSFSQIRFQRGNPFLSDQETSQWLNEEVILLDSERQPLTSESFKIRSGVYLSAKLDGKEEEIIGYRARKNTPPVDLRMKVPTHLFWEPLLSRKTTPVILEPDEFYIFASKELIRLPPSICAEMIPFDASNGEVRTHYAGFFDSGFGYSFGKENYANASSAVLEVRSRDVPFLVEDGHPLFRLALLRNVEKPDLLYGQDLDSNYQSQRLKLAKQFV